MVESAGNKVDQVAEKRMQQALTQVGKEIERIVSLVIEKATEELY